MNTDPLQRASMRVTRQQAAAPRLSFEALPWMSDAACLEYPSETFFPEKGNTAVSREAKRICGGCLVRDVCLAYALERGERWGVWGGLSETERRMLARRSGIRRSTGRKDPRPRTHLCPVVGCGYAGPTADALSSHRYKKHRVVEGAA